MLSKFPVTGRRKKTESGGFSPFIAMMKPAASGKWNDFTRIQFPLYIPIKGRVLVQSAMGPVPVVVIQVFVKHLSQVFFTDDDMMVEAIPSDRSDHSFHITVLPWAFGGGNDLLDPHILDALPEGAAVDSVPVPEQIFWRGIPGKGRPDLLEGPGGSGIPGDVEMNDSPSVMTQNQKHVQDLEVHGGDGEEIHGADGCEVVVQEGFPRLSRPVGRWFRHEVRYRPFGYFEAELEQFAVDTRRTP